VLTVRLPAIIERDLNQFCASRHLRKSQVVQQALVQYMATANCLSRDALFPELDLTFLSPDDPIRQFIGIANDGPSTNEWMDITRGEE
jgi:hypothetical protein